MKRYLITSALPYANGPIHFGHLAGAYLPADIFNRPAMRASTYETSGLGAAMDCAVGLKIHSDFATAVEEMTAIGEVFEPKPEHVELYDALYHRVYKKMYKHLKPLYEAIKEITGYPE